MNAKARLEKLAYAVVEAGLPSNTLQAALVKIAEKHDLTKEQIDRVAEMTNRHAQVSMYKMASDKRATFKLADPTLIHPTSTMHKEASYTSPATNESFDIPNSGNISKLSVMQAEINPASVMQYKVAELQGMVKELHKQADYYNTLLQETEGQALDVTMKMKNQYKETIGAAVDMIMTGVTLPSMYLAVVGAVNGNDATNDDMLNADALMLGIIKELKARNIPNYRMGFKVQESASKFNELSAEELLALCMKMLGAETGFEKKVAEYDKKRLMFEEATDSLNKKPGLTLDKVYLDGATTASSPRVINGENQFVINVVDLVSEQKRLVKLKNSSEYIGQQLSEIKHMIKEAEDTTVAYAGKTAHMFTAMDNAFERLSNSGVMKAVGHQSVSNIANVLGPSIGVAGQIYAQNAGMAQQRKVMKEQHELDMRRIRAEQMGIENSDNVNNAAPAHIGMTPAAKAAAVITWLGLPKTAVVGAVAGAAVPFATQAAKFLGSKAFGNVASLSMGVAPVVAQGMANSNDGKNRRAAKTNAGMGMETTAGVFI